MQPTIEQLIAVISYAERRAFSYEERQRVQRVKHLAAFCRVAMASFEQLKAAVVEIQEIATRAPVGVLESRFVVSSTNPDTIYETRRTPKGWECSCKGFAHRGRCKHIATSGKAA